MLQDSYTFSGFSVRNAQEALDFYTSKLGLEVRDTGMGFEIQLKDRSPVFFYEKPDHIAATFTILNFVVEDIDAIVDELTSKGVAFEHYTNLPAPQDQRAILRGKAANQGPDIAWFKDPSGNILSILSN